MGAVFGWRTSLVSQLFICGLFFNFLKFLNLFTRFYGLLAMTTHLVILSLLQKGDQAACKAQAAAKNPHFVFSISLSVFCVDTSLSLSMTRQVSMTKFMTKRVFGMTNSGFCLKMTDKEDTLCHLATIDKSHNFAHQKHFFTQILKQKFKFFTQNLRHFINPTRFINLIQILSLMQGFSYFYPKFSLSFYW